MSAQIKVKLISKKHVKLFGSPEPRLPGHQRSALARLKPDRPQPLRTAVEAPRRRAHLLEEIAVLPV